jgi:hypothetical protein
LSEIDETDYYSPAGNIGDTQDLEERPDQLGHAIDPCELPFNLILELLAAASRRSGHPGSLHMAPDQFVGLEP